MHVPLVNSTLQLLHSELSFFLQRGSATQRTQPQLVYGPLLSQIKWSPHIKVNSLSNRARRHKRPNGCHLISFQREGVAGGVKPKHFGQECLVFTRSLELR